MSDSNPERVTAAIESTYMRGVLGRLPTAVVVVAGIGPGGRPAGMTVGTFNSVSLDPPMVGFMPDRKSSSWPAIRESGSFCANILSDRQEELCRRFARNSSERFIDTKWRPAPSGAPILAGSTAWIDCDIAAIHPAGDHDIVVGQVNALETQNEHLPLVFLQGAYGRIASLSLTAWDPTIVEPMRLADVARPDMEQLASNLGRECILSAAVKSQIIMLASSNAASNRKVPTRVGQRLPLATPLGAIFVAWSNPGVQAAWLVNVAGSERGSRHARLAAMLQTIRERGFSVATGRGLHSQIEQALQGSAVGEGSAVEALPVTEEQLTHLEPTTLDQAPDNEVRSLAVPVFAADGSVLLTVGLHRFPTSLSVAEVTAFARQAQEAAKRIQENVNRVQSSAAR